MLGKKARNYFLGKGEQKVGCAQAVAKALHEHFNLQDDFVADMANNTGGKAPQGYCGAVYAALRIAENKAPEEMESIKEYFKNVAGGITCRDIRKEKRLMCADCVEQATRLSARTSIKDNNNS